MYSTQQIITFSLISDVKRRIAEAHQQYGDIFGIKVLRNYQFMVSDPKLFEIILSSSTHYMQKSSMVRNGFFFKNLPKLLFFRF